MCNAELFMYLFSVPEGQQAVLESGAQVLGVFLHGQSLSGSQGGQFAAALLLPTPEARRG